MGQIKHRREKRDAAKSKIERLRKELHECGTQVSDLCNDLAALEDDGRALLEETQQAPATPPPEADGGTTPVEPGEEDRGLASNRPWRKVTARGGLCRGEAGGDAPAVDDRIVSALEGQQAEAASHGCCTRGRCKALDGPIQVHDSDEEM